MCADLLARLHRRIWLGVVVWEAIVVLIKGPQ